MKAIQIEQFGGPEAMKFVDLPNPEPDSGLVRVKIEAAGINYIDTYQRAGLYPVPLPYTLGLEGAGTVEAVGPGVTEFKEGDRVAWTGVAGSYATHAIAPASRLVALPDKLSFRDGAASMLQGMTAHYLSHSTYPLQSVDHCLVHAAAGGVGLLLCQMARQRGAHVIGTTSTEEKAALAREAGAHEVILYSQQPFEPEVKRITDGRGVEVVYDAVGKDTFVQSLGCLVPRGMLVLYGQSSGPVGPFDLQILNRKGSLYVTRPSLGHYIASREDLMQRSADVLGGVASGTLSLRVEHTYPLAEAAEAHRALEGRRTTGKILLLP